MSIRVLIIDDEQWLGTLLIVGGIALVGDTLAGGDPIGTAGETGSLTANYLIVRNVRLVMEAGRDFEASQTRVSLGVVSAF